MRCAMTRVLPEPGPARISSGPSIVVTASRCGGLRSSRMFMRFRVPVCGGGTAARAGAIGERARVGARVDSLTE